MPGVWGLCEGAEFLLVGIDSGDIKPKRGIGEGPSGPDWQPWWTGSWFPRTDDFGAASSFGEFLRCSATTPYALLLPQLPFPSKFFPLSFPPLSG